MGVRAPQTAVSLLRLRSLLHFQASTQAVRQELANFQDRLEERSFERLDRVTNEKEILMSRSAELRGQVEEQESVVNELQSDSENVGHLAKEWMGELGYQAAVGGEDGGDIVSSLEAEKALLETTVVGLEKKVLDLEKQLRSIRREGFFELADGEEQGVDDSFAKPRGLDDSVYVELQEQLEEYRANLQEMDLVRSDLEGEKEALENLVLDLRKQLKESQRKEAQIAPQAIDQLTEIPSEVTTGDEKPSDSYLRRIEEEFIVLGIMQPEEADTLTGQDSEKVEALLSSLKKWSEQKLDAEEHGRLFESWTTIDTAEETQTEEDLSLVRREVERFEMDNSILRQETERLIRELGERTTEVSLLQNQMEDNRSALERITNDKRELVVMINERDEKIGELEDSFESQITQLKVSKDGDLSLLQSKHEDVLNLLDESRSEFSGMKTRNEDLLTMIDEKQLDNDEVLKKNGELLSSISTLESQLEGVRVEKEDLISRNVVLAESGERLQRENTILSELVKESEDKERLNKDREVEFVNMKLELERLNERAVSEQGNFEQVLEELASCREENGELVKKVNGTEARLIELGSSLNEKISELDLLNQEMDRVNELAAAKDAACKDQERKLFICLEEKDELVLSLDEKERQIGKVQLDLREKGADNDLLRLDIVKLNRNLKEKDELLQKQFSGDRSAVSENSNPAQDKLAQMFHLLEGKEQEIEALRLKNTSLVEVVNETERNDLQTRGEYEVRIRTLMEERESLLTEVAEKDEELITQRDRLDAMKEKMSSKDQASAMLHGEHVKLLALNESQGNEIAKLRERISSIQKMLEEKEGRIHELQRGNFGSAQMAQEMKSLRVEHERLSTLVHEKDQQISFLVGMGSQPETPVVPVVQTSLQQSSPSQEHELIKSERDALQREVSELRTSHSNLQLELRALTGDLGDEKSATSELTRENQAIKEELADVKSRLSQAEGLRSSWLEPKEANRMEREIQELKRDLEDKKTKLDSIKRTLENEKNSFIVDLESVRNERDIVSQQKDKETTELKNKILQLFRSLTESNIAPLQHGLEDIDSNFQALLQVAKTTRDTAIRERENEIKSLREQISNLNVLNRTSSQSRDADLVEALREKEELHKRLVRVENEKEDSLKEKEALVADLQDQVVSLTELVSEKTRSSSREREIALKQREGLERDLHRVVTEKDDAIRACEQKQNEVNRLQGDVQRFVDSGAEGRGKVAGLERELEEQGVVLQGKDAAITGLMAEKEHLSKSSELMEQKVAQLQSSLIESQNDKKAIQEKMQRELERLREHLIQVSLLLLSSKSTFSQPFKEKMYELGSENWWKTCHRWPASSRFISFILKFNYSVSIMLGRGHTRAKEAS